MDDLERELRFYGPIYEFVSNDLQWVRLNWRLVRILLKQTETKHDMEQQAKEAKIDLDKESIEYIWMLTHFFEHRIAALLEYFDQYYRTITPLMQTSPDFFYGYFDYISNLVRGIKAEIKTNQISLLQLRYLHNYVFLFYLEIVEGINNSQAATSKIHFGVAAFYIKNYIMSYSSKSAERLSASSRLSLLPG